SRIPSASMAHNTVLVASMVLVANTALAHIRQLPAHRNIRLDPRRKSQHMAPVSNQDTVETTARIKVDNPAAGTRRGNRRAGQIRETTRGHVAHATKVSLLPLVNP